MEHNPARVKFDWLLLLLYGSRPSTNAVGNGWVGFCECFPIPMRGQKSERKRCLYEGCFLRWSTVEGGARKRTDKTARTNSATPLVVKIKIAACRRVRTCWYGKHTRACFCHTLAPTQKLELCTRSSRTADAPASLGRTPAV